MKNWIAPSVVVTALAAVFALSPAAAEKKKDKGSKVYTSQAKLVMAGPAASAERGESVREFLGTQMELIQSGEIRRRVGERLDVKHPDVERSPVEIETKWQKDTWIITVYARGKDPKFTQLYLDATLDEFIGFRRDMKKKMTDTTLNLITKELLRLERELKTREQTLREVEGTSSPVLEQAKKEALADHMKKLLLEKLELESAPKSKEEKEEEAKAKELERLDKLIAGYEGKLVEAERGTKKLETARNNLERTKSLYENMLKSLRELDLSKALEWDQLTIMERATAAR